jgi:hypothetical protein
VNKEIDLTSEKMEELMSQMSEEARGVFQALLMRATTDLPMKIIRRFVDNFSESDPVDSLIATTVSKIIQDAEGAIREDMHAKEKVGDQSYSGIEAAKIVLEHLRKVADGLEKSIKNHKNCDCQVQH